MNRVARALIVWRIALRNVGRARGKSLIVGAILFFGTALVVLGSALVDAMDDGMRRSVTQSISGHLQIYSADAKDDLALFGDEFAGMPDIGNIPDFQALAAVVRPLPEVAAVVPMGIDFALGFQGNELDRWLSDLRLALRQGRDADARRLTDLVRAVVERVQGELRQGTALLGGPEFEAELAAVDRAASPEFWAGFQADPSDALEFLENRIAPLESEVMEAGLPFLGTDLQAFARWFDRFELVEGEMVPPGRRGFLFNHGFYEDVIKHRVARDLDHIRRERAEGRTLAREPELRARRDLMVGQYRRVLYQLDRKAAEEVAAGLHTLLGQPDAPLPELLQAFLRVDDETFDARYAWFYAHVAPHLRLYSVPVGDELALQSFTRSGYRTAVKVKVYGTFQFKGLDKSMLGRAFNLLDLVTFRELYGLMTPERRQEIEALRQQAGVADLRRDDAEAALFGEAEPVERTADPGAAQGFDELAEAGLERITPQAAADVFPAEELERGVALNAAVILHDPERLEEARAAIQKALDDAGMRMRVVSWQQASGMVGQVVVMVRVVLYVAVFLVFLVAMVIINNSMVIATMERVREIGTMRAIGAQRGFVSRLFLAETAALGLVAGALGAAFGAGIVFLLGVYGIPAANPFTTFLFSGPRLHPEVDPLHLVVGMVLVFLFGLLSTLYPSRVAARIPPVEAMGSGG